MAGGGDWNLGISLLGKISLSKRNTPMAKQNFLKRTRKLFARSCSPRLPQFDPDLVWDTLRMARNLHFPLEDEKLPTLDAVNRGVWPYFPAVWRLAARCHLCITQRRLRAKSMGQGSFCQSPIASIKEGEFTLSFNRGESGDLYMLLSFPRARGAMYPISGYSKIAEFRTMLAALAPDGSKCRWEGEHFFGYVAASDEGKGTDYWFRAHQNGITLGLLTTEWKSVQVLFRRA
jgi:hypothetical protein